MSGESHLESALTGGGGSGGGESHIKSCLEGGGGSLAGESHIQACLGIPVAVNTVALFDWDYQGVIAPLGFVTNAVAGTDFLGQTITEVAQGPGRVDDGVTPFSTAPVKAGYGWHVRSSTPPSPGNRINLSTPFSAAGDWTLEGWMNNGTGALGRLIMHAHNDSVVAETEIVSWVLFGASAAVTVDIRDDNAVSIWSSGNLAATILQSVWYHCAVTFDSAAGQYNVFFDGVRLAQSPLSTAATDPMDAVGHINQNPSVSGAWTETRLSNIIRYAGATYTVPAAPFVVD